MIRLIAPAANVKRDPMMFLLSIFLTLEASGSSLSTLLRRTLLSPDGPRAEGRANSSRTVAGPRAWFFKIGKISQMKTPVSEKLMTISVEKVV